MITNILEKSVNIFKPFIPIFLLLLVLSIILHLFFNDINFNEGFVAHRQKIFESNKFQQITLPNLKSYDIELAIPAGQTLHSTVQGNWGISTDANNEGMTIGVFRDGYSADGSIFKGKSGKLYKRMLEQGPYVLKYEIRDGKDVKIYVNAKLIHNLKDEGVPSGKLKVVGTNYHNYNKLVCPGGVCDPGNKEEDETGRGRREIDYIKFIPKEMNKTKEGFISRRRQLWPDREGMMNISNDQLKHAFKTAQEHPEIVKEIGSLVMEQMNNKKNTPDNSHPQLQKNLMQILNNSGLGNIPDISLKESMTNLQNQQRHTLTQSQWEEQQEKDKVQKEQLAKTQQQLQQSELKAKLHQKIVTPSQNIPKPPEDTINPDILGGPLKLNEKELEKIKENDKKMRVELMNHFEKKNDIDKETLMKIGNKYKPPDLTTNKEQIFLKYINKLFENGPIPKITVEELLGDFNPPKPQETDIIPSKIKKKVNQNLKRQLWLQKKRWEKKILKIFFIYN